MPSEIRPRKRTLEGRTGPCRLLPAVRLQASGGLLGRRRGGCANRGLRTRAPKCPRNGVDAAIKFAADFEVPKTQDDPSDGLERLVRHTIPADVARNFLVPIRAGLAWSERRGVAVPK